MRESPESDRRIGILYYATESEGIGGVLKAKPSDFVVREVSQVEIGKEGEYLILEVTKENWDTHILVREIARRLRISKERISFAGTKDKFAVTTQKISIRGVSEDEVKGIRIKDVSIRILGRAKKPISLGDLIGNEFKIVVRVISLGCGEVKRRIEAISAEIERIGGVPNFFGTQRFGTKRPITHVVGRHLVCGEIEKAVLSYIGTSFESESEAVREARSLAFEDFKEALRRMPKSLKYERSMLAELLRRKCSCPSECEEEDFRAALNVLPKKLRRMFVHAFQAYLFNLVLSKRIERGIPLNEAQVGDFVCFSHKGVADTKRVEKVTEAKADAMNRLVKAGRAFVVAPLFGFKTELSEGVAGEIEREVLKEASISLADFRCESVPELSSEGSYRPILTPFNSDAVEICSTAEGSAKEGSEGVKARFKFFLPKSSYATVVMREFMKSGGECCERA